MLPGAAQNGGGELRVEDDSRQRDRADHRRDGDQGSRLGGFGVRTSIMVCENIHEFENAVGRGGTRVLVAPRQFAAEAGEGATLRGIVAVVGREVLCQDGLKAILAQRWTRRHLVWFSGRGKGCGTSLSNELIL